MSGYFRLTVIVATLCLSSVTGIQFALSSNRVDPTNPPQEKFWLNCTAAFLKDVHSLLFIKIVRESSSGSTEVIATVTSTETVIPTTLPSYWRTATVSGSLYPPTDTDHSVTDSFVNVGVNASSFTCSDARTYRCEIKYLISVSLDDDSAAQNSSLAITALPSTPALTAKHVSTNEMFVGVGLSSDNPADIGTGEELEISCTADIGSDSLRTIQWRKSSEVGTGELIMYNGYVLAGNATPITGSDCRFTRTSKMQYNTTAFDANRNSNNMLRFLCIVDGAPSDRSQTFYVSVAGGSEGNQDQSVSKAGSGDAGIIAGAVVGSLVLIVIVALLVYFLWYRRRSSGDDYKTKEEYGSENPNMAPQTDLYATPNKPKPRRGHENRGLDEPHEFNSRRRDDYNGRGRANFGMEREDDDYDHGDYESRDGSPTLTDRGISHMGVDPINGSIGTGV